MAWNPQPAKGGANWFGNPSLATNTQLTSTTAGTYTYITATSNVLQSEINSIVAGGTTSLWANYPAIRNVDLSGNNLSNVNNIQARFLSTLDLQVSSINGAEIILTASNVTIQNIEMKNGTVTSSNSSSSNTTLNRTVGAINAVTATVTNINQAVGGVLSNSFGALQQAYWGVAVAGQVVDLANGTVQLATGIQAMVDSRQNNLISGPAGPPGQTANVYESFNHTTQFQFSTLGSQTYTVFRTTNQVYPNQTFGREVFISTIIPAGTKVVRSVSDPMNMPIISTQLLSTTNFIQSFGQWSAVLGDDYIIKASTLIADYINASSISTFNFSTGAASISSINGRPASDFLNTNTFTSLSTNALSSATITASTIYSDKISTGLILGAGYNGSLIFGDINNTNYIQTFVNTGGILRNTVPGGTFQIDSGNLILGWNSNISFNGSPYAPINPNLTLTSLTVPSISTINIQGSNAFFANATISSLTASSVTVQNIIDNFVSTTTGEFDVVNTSTLVAAQIFTNTIQTNNITGIERLSLSNIVGNSYSVIYPTKNLSSYVSSISLQQSGFFNFETNAAPAPPSGIQYINSIYGVWVYPAISPVGTTNLLQQNVYIQPGYAGTPSSGSITFFAVGSAGFLVQFIQQGDGLNQAAIPFIIEPGWYVRIDYVFTPGYYQNATYTVVYLYTPVPGSATSTLTTSKVNLITDVYEAVLDTNNIYQNSGVTTNGLGNLALNVSTIAFGSNTSRNNLYPFQFNGAVQGPIVSTLASFCSSINGVNSAFFLNPTTLPSLSTITISTAKINTSSIQMIGGFIASTNLALLSSANYDFTKVVNLVSTSFSTISSFQNNILSYTYNASVGDETSFNIGAGYTVTGNNVSQWASTILIGNSTQVQPISLEIDNDPGSGWTGTGTFDVKRTLNNGQPPYDIYVAYTLGVSPLIIDINDYNLYRFTKTTTGVGGWSYIINPPTYQTSNTNVLQIYQNLTDVTIATTDNLNIIAGSIKLQGNLQLSNINITKAFIQNLTASNIQFQNVSTINEAVTNLYAGYFATSSININTQQTTPFILGNYSNTYNVTSYFTPPPTQIITSENDMTITSLNPSYTYSGGGTDVLTFDIGGQVWLNTTLQTNTNWFYSLYRINNSVRVNISTVAGGTSNANFPANTNITNFIIKGANTLGLYTSASGFIGNITGGNITLYWTSLNDFSTKSYVPWTGLTYLSKQQIAQTVSSVYYNATCAQYFSSPTLNINTNPSSNSPTVFFNGKNIEVFSQRVDGFLVNAGNYGKGDAAATASYGGRTFPVSQYNCIVSQSAFNAYGEAALAVNEQVWQTYQDTNGNWAFHFYCTTATVPAAGTINFYAIAAVTMIPYDLGHFSGFQSPDHLGEGNGGPPIFPAIQLSTIVASTITCLAQENISFNANFGIPTFLGPGNIALNANSNIDLMANYDIIAGANHNISLTATNDISISSPNINATTSNVTISGYTIGLLASTITLTAGNAIAITAPGTNFYGPVGINGYDLYMNNQGINDLRNLNFMTSGGPINYVTEIDFHGGGFIKDYTPSIHLFDIDGNNCDQTRLLNGSANIVLLPSGATYFGGSDFYFQGNVHMLNHDITDVANMINHNSGIQIGNYSPAGAGDLLLYSASNNITITTGSVKDINMNVSGNFNLNGGGGSQYVTFTNAGTSMQFAGPNIYFTTTTGGANFNLPISIGTAYSLNLQDAPIYSAKNIEFGPNVFIHRYTPGGYTNPFLDIQGAGGDGQLRLINGSAQVALVGNSDLGITPTSGYNIVLNGPTSVTSNLTMNDNPIRLRNDQYHVLAFGNSGTYNVGVNGPYLVGYNGGALGTSGTSFNNKSLEWSYTDVYIYKNLNMSNNNITNVTYIGGTTSSDLSISANSAHNLLLTGQQISLTSSSNLNLYSYGDTNINTTASKNVNISPGGNLNLQTTTAGTQISLNTPTLYANIQGDAVFNCSNSFNVSTSQVNVSGTATLLYSLLTSVKGVFQRWLGTNAINQPVIQYGTATGSGPNGSVTVSLPVAYTSGTSFIATASMMDTTPAKMSVNCDSASQITIYWDQAGSGSQTMSWNCMGN